MNIIFMRHGEATDNVKELISDREIYFSTLTASGSNTVAESLSGLPDKVDKVYVSPMPRTIQTASLVKNKYPTVEYVIDDRLREIDHGKYSGQKNNADLDRTRELQVAGDYFVRFGQYGENKIDIETRLSEFLNDIRRNNFNDNTIMIVSHGSVTSFMKRLLGLRSPHIKTGKAEEFTNVDFSYLDCSMKKLADVRKKSKFKRAALVDNADLSGDLKEAYKKIARLEFNDIEFDDDVFANLIRGVSGGELKRLSSSIPDSGVVAITLVDNVASFVDVWIQHYIELGVKNFAIINCESSDDTITKIKAYQSTVNIDLWEASCTYNCSWACGARQYLMSVYGVNRWYLNIDSDELFVYDGWRSRGLTEFANASKAGVISSMLIDVYRKGVITDSSDINGYHYVDKGTYVTSERKPYGIRIHGGPRSRIFGVRPSLQKYPLVYYTGKEVLANDHFYYPYKLNRALPIRSYLLHYKFLPGDIDRYKELAASGVHWNQSSEYKEYINKINSDPNVSFYDGKISVDIGKIF